MKKLLSAAAFLIMFAGIASAQTKFTSAYTSLYKACQTIRGENGTDDAFVCKGVGGYQVRIYSSAATLQINAELMGKDELFPLATLDFSFNESKSRVEWRMANGKPFAVILRVPRYAAPAETDLYFGKVVGEALIVRGLKGYGNINDEVDAKTPSANVKAREIADKAFASGK